MPTLAFAPTSDDLAARFFDIPSNMARLDIGQKGFLAEDPEEEFDDEDSEDEEDDEDEDEDEDEED